MLLLTFAKKSETRRSRSLRETASVSTPAWQRPDDRGFTLVELLAVIAILALLGSLSAAAFQLARRNYRLSASASSVEGVLQAARNTAVSWSLPVRVVVDPSGGIVTAYAFQTVGEWSFERIEGDTTYGISGESATLVGATAAPRGYVGQGIRLEETTHVRCGWNPRFDLRTGLYAEAWIYREDVPSPPQGLSARRRGTRRRPAGPDLDESRKARGILKKGDAFFLGITGDGSLEAALGSYRFRTRPGVVPPEYWMLVSLKFDGESATLAAGGIEMEAVPVGYEGMHPKDFPSLPESIPVDEGPLTIGSPRGSFAGLIDEVRLRGSTEPLSHALGPGERILGWKKEIWLDGKGHLDARFHEEPIRILIFEESADSRAGPLATGLPLSFPITFSEWVLKGGPEREGLREHVEEARLEEKLPAGRRVEIAVDRIGTVRGKFMR